jgi:DNA-binding transcriptional LysR family regulator
LGGRAAVYLESQAFGGGFRSAGARHAESQFGHSLSHIVRELLANGEYITAFPSSWVRFNALKILPVDLPLRPWPVAILTLKNRTLSPVVERFSGEIADISS